MMEASPWRYSTLDPPGVYLDQSNRMRPTYWSGEPRYVTTWEEAELNVAAQMRALGYGDAEVTGPGVDEGIDVCSSRALAQVKRVAVATGRPVLQLFFGACTDYPQKERWFFSASGYSRTAVKYANRRSILLFMYSVIGEIQPVNEIATEKLDVLLKARAKRIEKMEKHRLARVNKRSALHGLPSPVSRRGAA